MTDRRSGLGEILSFPLTTTFGDNADPMPVLAALGFVRGDQPCSNRSRNPGRLELERLAGEDWITIRRQDVDARSGRWSAVIDVDSDGRRATLLVGAASSEYRVQCYAQDAATAEWATTCLGVLAVEPDPVQDDQVKVAFHYYGERGVRSETRMMDAPLWDDIEQNYSAEAHDALAELMAMSSPERPGRLVLLHGPPGTGKTTAIRALARAWQDWCSVSYVMDPEVLFTRSAYLADLVLEADDFPDPDEDEPTPRWRLLVIEDADEIISSNARHQAGQALSRLLNLTDGMLGQGLRTLVLITTNEPVSALHPAATRPGRCLAEIEVCALSASEARAWVGPEHSSEVGADGATLAELYALRGELGRPKAQGPRSAGVGQYL